MKIAILIGVSEYASQQNLMASKNDVLLMNSLISIGNNYDSILMIDNETNTQTVKAKLTSFLQGNFGKEVDQLFFYFSGHGYFDGEEFHYIMSDFDSKRIKSTSLENSELDILIKSISPKLTVKIVDACNSGIPYIKDPTAFDKYINTSKQSFDKCYFMYSSESLQYSYADAKLSFFTKAIGEAVLSSKTELVRYKDIIDYVSDEFQGNEKQSPVFVSQANFTDIFVNALPDEKVFLKEILRLDDVKIEKKDKHYSLKQLIENDAKRFFEKDAAMQIYNSIPELIDSSFTLDGELQTLFEREVIIHNDYNSIPKIKSLSEWISNNNDGFFVRSIITNESYEDRVRKPGVLGLDIFSEDAYITVTKYRSVPTSLTTTTEVPFHVIQIKVKPRYPNLNSVTMFFLPLISRTKLMIFSTIASYKSVGWDKEQILTDDCKWSPKIVELLEKEKLTEYIAESFKQFYDSIYQPLLSSFDVTSKKEKK